MEKKVPIFHRIPITLIENGERIPWVAVADPLGKLRTSHTQIAVNEDERLHLGRWGEEAQIEQLKNIPEAEAG